MWDWEYTKLLTWDCFTTETDWRWEWGQHFIHRQEKFILTELRLKWWRETKIRFGSHSTGHACATHGSISRKREYFPLLPEEKPCADAVGGTLRPGLQDKNVCWLRIWNIRFWNFWLAMCLMTQSCVIGPNESQHPSIWGICHLQNGGHYFVCSLIALLSRYQVPKMKIQWNTDLTGNDTVCYVFSFRCEEEMLLSEVEWFYQRWWLKVRLDLGLFKSVDCNFDGILESLGML